MTRESRDLPLPDPPLNKGSEAFDSPSVQKRGVEGGQTGLVVLAIDPGREKCGLAVVSENGAIIARLVVQTPILVSAVKDLCRKFAPGIILLGSGTGSKPIRDALQSANLPVPIEAVEESHTSEAARKRFVRENPAKGWQRFLPRSLRTPDVPYDDYVAIILAERYIASLKISENDS